MESSSLLPTDPSVLFTTAGMQQFKLYFTGQADPMKDFGSLNTASIQKSMRTSDIDEVGDNSHLTFFEMLGHFSFGDYFKKETISWTYEFLTDVLKISGDRISATVFAGDPSTNSGQVIPFDSESWDAWMQLIPADRIRKGPRADNVWGPAGPEGPCGAANEVYVDNLEVATLVFMEYNCAKDGTLMPLPQKGVDVGWGFERITMISQEQNNIFETDLLQLISALVPSEFDTRIKRIITDHARAIAFLIADEVRPSNKEQGYVLRRLMRRIITYFHATKSVDNRLDVSVIHRPDLTVMHDIFAKIVEIYGSYYPELHTSAIIYEFDQEKEKFEKTLRQGLKELEKLQNIDAQSAFKLYESFGLPYEVIKELSGEKAKKLSRESFDEEFRKHQEISRAGAEKKFGGHGLLMDTGELKAGNEAELQKATRLHTATHLLHAALRKVLGSGEVHHVKSAEGGAAEQQFNMVKQQGSDITPERLRFDFMFPRKLTPEELKRVEDTVNEAVGKNYKVTKEEMSYEDAIKSGALAFFKLKYPPIVNVFTIGGTEPAEVPFSRELCGGPHVSNTVEIGKFKIIKEESISAGIRRIRAVVE